MNIDPKGKMPPSIMITSGSMNHFFSGIGRGTALILHGASGVPAKFRPRMVPTSVSGNITNMQMHVTATCKPQLAGQQKLYEYPGKRDSNTCHRAERYGAASVIVHCDEVNEERSATDDKR